MRSPKHLLCDEGLIRLTWEFMWWVSQKDPDVSITDTWIDLSLFMKLNNIFLVHMAKCIEQIRVILRCPAKSTFCHQKMWRCYSIFYFVFHVWHLLVTSGVLLGNEPNKWNARKRKVDCVTFLDDIWKDKRLQCWHKTSALIVKLTVNRTEIKSKTRRERRELFNVFWECLRTKRIDLISA